MFENFNLNQKVFSAEQKLIVLLKKLKRRFKYRKENLDILIVKRKRKMIEAFSGINGQGNQTFLHLKLNNHRSSEIEYDNLEQLSIFPKKHDYDGAVKGMVILQNTYNFDLTKASRKISAISKGTSGSEISYYDYSSSKVYSFQAQETVNFDDFLIFSHRAANYYHFYDSSIQFLVEAFDSYGKSNSSPNLYNYLRKMKSSILSIHNDFLLDRRKLFEKEFRVLPYLVNNEFKAINPKIQFEGNFKLNIYLYQAYINLIINIE